MKISEEQHNFINEKLRCTGSHHSGILDTTDAHLLPIILWDPLAGNEISLSCKYHGVQLTDTGLWTHDKTLKSRSPRILYHTNTNVLLISKLYVCSTCEKEARRSVDAFVMAHHPYLLGQLPKVKIPLFHLFSKAGVTRAAYEFIVNLSLAGTSFHEIETCFERFHGFNIALHGNPDPVNSLKHQSPSWKLIKDIFMLDFRLRLGFYEDEMRKIKPESLCIDHTFKAR